MKPILFNTEMVRGILDNRKTVTRRVVKPQPVMGGFFETCFDWRGVKAPYRPGDILYVRETWNRVKKPNDSEWHYEYKASCANPKYFSDGFTAVWRPSIHMPNEAARIFLRVTDVRVERLQDSFFKHGSTIFYLLREGIDIGEQCRECIDAYGSQCCIDNESECGVLDEVRSEFSDLWNRCYATPRPVKGEDGTIDHYESYPWEDIQETRTYKGKPWYVIGNPWIWVIEFERCTKPTEGPA